MHKTEIQYTPLSMRRADADFHPALELILLSLDHSFFSWGALSINGINCPAYELVNGLDCYPYQQRAYISDKYIFLTCLSEKGRIEYLCDCTRGKPRGVSVDLSDVNPFKLLPDLPRDDLKLKANRAINNVLKGLNKYIQDDKL